MPESSQPTTATEGPAAAERPALTGGEAALKHLTITSCPSGEGDLEATGSIKNRKAEAADYVVTVTWLDEKSQVLTVAYATAEDVEPKQKVTWTVAGTVDAPATSCTTRLDRGTARSKRPVVSVPASS